MHHHPLNMTPLALLVEIGGVLGFMPYRWNWKTQQMVFRPSRFWKLTHDLWSTVILGYAFFLIHQSYRVYTHPLVTDIDRTKVLYMCLLHIGLNIGFLLDMPGWGEHHRVFNQLVAYSAKFQDQYDARPNQRLVKWTLRCQFFAWCFVTSNALAVFRTPESIRLLSSLMTDPRRASKGIKLGFFILHLVIFGCQFYSLMFNSMILVLYNNLMVPIIDKLRYDVDGRQGQQRSLTPYQIHKHSIRLAILQSQYTTAFSSWVLLIVVWCVLIAALNMFQAVAFQTLRSLVGSLVVTGLFAALCKSAGSLFERAQESKATWRGIKGINWFPKYARAYRPARVPLGSFFYFDRGIWPTIFNIILGQAANLIVSYKKE